jgi:rhamnogalacturonyl hydrolase YesR
VVLTFSGSPADPASLGVAALLLSCDDARYFTAAQRQAEYLNEHATRFLVNTTHAAISHRDEPPELWGDFVYMVPPFLAYYGVATGDLTFIKEAVQQCQIYRDVLETSITVSDGSSCVGLWRHIVSQPPHLEPHVCCSDPDVWLTSNAWAIAGLTRVLATIIKWLPPKGSAVDRDSYIEFVTEAKATLLTTITRMLNCSMAQSRDPHSGLLKNYLDGEGHPSVAWAYGDAAGTALATSAIYRLAVLVPEQFSRSTYLAWAAQNLAAVANHVDGEGKVSPVASVDVVPSKHAAEQTSEGQSVAILLYAAWRDCVGAGVCQQSWGEMLRSWPLKTAG